MEVNEEGVNANAALAGVDSLFAHLHSRGLVAWVLPPPLLTCPFVALSTHTLSLDTCPSPHGP